MASNSSSDDEQGLQITFGEESPPSNEDISIDQGVPERRSSKVAESAGPPCPACSAPLAVIRIDVDGRTLLMESCDVCDTRRWQLAGEQIDLAEALNQVGEHSGRRRSRT